MICLWQIHVATQLIGCNMLVDSSMHYLLQKLAGMGNNEIDLWLFYKFPAVTLVNWSDISRFP